MKRTTLGVLVSVCLCILLLAPQSALAVSLMVDSFDDGAFDLIANSGTPTASDSQSGLSGVLGGQRDSQVMWMTGPGRVRLTGLATAGFLALSSDALTDGLGMLTYPNLNLDMSSYISIDLDVVSSDLGGVPVDITLTDGAGAMDTSGDVASGGGIISIPIMDYTGVDLSDITQIKVTIDPPMEFDITLDAISITVPEPASLVLFGAALVGLLAVRRSS